MFFRVDQEDDEITSSHNVFNVNFCSLAGDSFKQQPEIIKPSFVSHKPLAQCLNVISRLPHCDEDPVQIKTPNHRGQHGHLCLPPRSSHDVSRHHLPERKTSQAGGNPGLSVLIQDAQHHHSGESGQRESEDHPPRRHQEQEHQDQVYHHRLVPAQHCCPGVTTTNNLLGDNSSNSSNHNSIKNFCTGVDGNVFIRQISFDKDDIPNQLSTSPTAADSQLRKLDDSTASPWARELSFNRGLLSRNIHPQPIQPLTSCAFNLHNFSCSYNHSRFM